MANHMHCNWTVQKLRSTFGADLASDMISLSKKSRPYLSIQAYCRGITIKSTYGYEKCPVSSHPHQLNHPNDWPRKLALVPPGQEVAIPGGACISKMPRSKGEPIRKAVVLPLWESVR